MKRILIGYIEDGRHSGIDKYLLNFAEVAQSSGVHLDFLTAQADPELQKLLAGMGFGLFEVPRLTHPLGQYQAIQAILRQGNYDGVYFNISEAFHCMGLLAAARCRVPSRIVHSHSAGVDRQNQYVRCLRLLLHKIFRSFLYKKATLCLACSEVAGRWMFPCDFEIIYNAVDGARFAYDPAARKSVRAALGISEQAKVLIHIGHFCYAKNNFFLMDVMKKVLDRDPDAVLISAGTGVDFESVQAYANHLGIDSHVHFLGVRSDIPSLLSAADVFVFPSRFEGLSVTCIEAQFSGLPCVLSTGNSPETQISEQVVFLSLQAPDAWAEEILRIGGPRLPANLKREATERYDLANQKKQLKSIVERI